MDQKQNDHMPQPAYYYQQQAVNNIYNSPISAPMQMMHSPLSNPMYLQPPQSPPHDFNKRPGNYRGNVVRKQEMGSMQSIDNNSLMQSNWYNSIATSPYMQSNVNPPLIAGSGGRINSQPPASQHRTSMEMMTGPHQMNQHNMQQMNMPMLTPHVGQSNSIPPHLRQPTGQMQHLQQQSHQNPNFSQGNSNIRNRSPLNSDVPQLYSAANSPVTLNVSNLPQHTDGAMLHELFSAYGKVLLAQVDMLDPNKSNEARLAVNSNNGKPVCSGKGRVQLQNASQADYAVQSLNGAVIFENSGPIQVIVGSSAIR
jgi:hypothetical protein